MANHVGALLKCVSLPGELVVVLAEAVAVTPVQAPGPDLLQTPCHAPVHGLDRENPGDVTAQ